MYLIRLEKILQLRDALVVCGETVDIVRRLERKLGLCEQFKPLPVNSDTPMSTEIYTFLLSTNTLCASPWQSSSTRVRPRPPVPPATAIRTMIGSLNVVDFRTKYMTKRRYMYNSDTRKPEMTIQCYKSNSKDRN